MFMCAYRPDDHLIPPKKTGFSSVLHRISCIIGIIITIFCLFCCYLSVANALQDVRKFEHTGTFAYFLHFLDEYDFAETVLIFLLMAVELLLYLVQYRRAAQKQLFRGSILYFTVIMVLHLICCLHANALPLPDFGPANAAESAGMWYRHYTNVTISPSIGYFISYHWRICNPGSSKNT